MLKIIRYLFVICLLISTIIYFNKHKNSKLRILKLVLGVILSFLFLIMPFENLLLKFDTPKQAFDYAVSNRNIIKKVENEQSALVIYEEKGSTFSTLISKSGDKWKATFMPDDQILSRLENNEIFLITKERNSNNFYIMIAVDPDIKSVSDNYNSTFEVFTANEFKVNYVAYVENCTDNYIIDIDGSKYQLI